MSKLTLVNIDNTWFVKHDAFMLPVFDGKPNFDVKVAMVAIGAVADEATSHSWYTKFTAIEVGGYLAFLQTSDLGPGAARRAWVMQWKLSRMMHDLPYTWEGDIDWTTVKKTVEQEIARDFPLCS